MIYNVFIILSFIYHITYVSLHFLIGIPSSSSCCCYYYHYDHCFTVIIVAVSVTVFCGRCFWRVGAVLELRVCGGEGWGRWRRGG